MLVEHKILCEIHLKRLSYSIQEEKIIYFNFLTLACLYLITFGDILAMFLHTCDSLDHNGFPKQN